MVIFHYSPSRGHEVLNDLLGAYPGVVQCDGYSAYTAYGSENKHAILAGCFAHAVIKFKDCLKAQKKLPHADITKSRCLKAMKIIRKLYDIEGKCETKTPAERKAYRQEHSKPVLNELRAWVDKTLPKVVKNSLLGKAVHYLHNQWDKLIVYCDHGEVPIDNNPVEQVIRPFVIGRNAWLFSATPSGARASALLYSVVITARVNGVEPYRYLRKILAELPQIDPKDCDSLDQLLPWNVDPASLVIPDY